MVTVDGVILGLVYTFATANKSSVPSVVKVGAISLVVGVIIGLLLYALSFTIYGSTRANTMQSSPQSGPLNIFSGGARDEIDGFFAEVEAPH